MDPGSSLCSVRDDPRFLIQKRLSDVLQEMLGSSPSMTRAYFFGRNAAITAGSVSSHGPSIRSMQ
jgi:hypothetical protein